MTTRGRRQLFATEKFDAAASDVCKLRKDTSKFQDYCNNSNDEVSSDFEILDSSAKSYYHENQFKWIKTPKSIGRIKNSQKNASSSSHFTKEIIADSCMPKDGASITSTGRKSQRSQPSPFLQLKRLSLIEAKENNVSKKKEKAVEGPSKSKDSKQRNVAAWLAASNKKVISGTPSMELEVSPALANGDCIVSEVLAAIYGPVQNKNAVSPRRIKTDAKKPNKELITFATDMKLNACSLKMTPIRKCARKFFDDSPMSARKTSKTSDNSDQKRKLLSADDGSPFQVDYKRRKLSRKVDTNNASSAQKTPRRTFLASLSVSTPTSVGHPEARNYKINFSKTKEELCVRLFKLYNNQVFENKLPEDMAITWNPKMRGTAGFCYNKKRKISGEIIRSARIELASKVVDRADRLRDTLLHEMCHAAAWIIDGVISGHGRPWQVWTRRAVARFPELPRPTKCHNYEIMSKYTYRCVVCSYSINRQTKSIDIDRKRCGHCLGKLELLYNKKKRGETEVPEFETTRTLKPANAFGIFVKENYKRLKEENAENKHGDIMKLLSKEYAVYKAVTTP